MPFNLVVPSIWASPVTTNPPVVVVPEIVAVSGVIVLGLRIILPMP